MQNHETMTIQQLQQEFTRQGRVARKLLTGGTYGAMSKAEMIATLTRWQRQDEQWETNRLKQDTSCRRK